MGPNNSHPDIDEWHCCVPAEVPNAYRYDYARKMMMINSYVADNLKTSTYAGAVYSVDRKTVLKHGYCMVYMVNDFIVVWNIFSQTRMVFLRQRISFAYSTSLWLVESSVFHMKR